MNIKSILEKKVIKNLDGNDIVWSKMESNIEKSIVKKWEVIKKRNRKMKENRRKKRKEKREMKRVRRRGENRIMYIGIWENRNEKKGKKE